jgi:alcohol dehydrogenase
MNRTLPPLAFQHVASELRLYCGVDSLTALARELKRCGSQRAAVVCGNTVGQSAAMDLLRKALGSTLVGESRHVKSNSPVPAVEEVARVLRELQADAVISVGGGSAAVTGRAASILLAEGKPAHELCTRRLPTGDFESPRLNAAKLPQFIIPTTPSTAFVKTGSAVHDVNTGQRLALFDPKTRAKALFVHPDFLRSAPPELIRSASLNTLSTAIEALESPKCDPLSEASLVHALRLIAGFFGDSSLEQVAVREQLVIAAILCGRGTEQAGGGIATVLSHAIGHRARISGGIVNAIVLPHTMRFNATATQDTAPRIVDGLNTLLADEELRRRNSAGAVELLERLLGTLNLPRTLRDIGIAQADLKHIAETAMADWFIQRGPRPVTGADELLHILELAW